MPSHLEETNGIVNPDELYTLRTFTSRLGIKAATLRSARRAGLKVYYVHKQAYVYGKDWIEYVLKEGGRNSDGNGSIVS